VLSGRVTVRHWLRAHISRHALNRTKGGVLIQGFQQGVHRHAKSYFRVFRFAGGLAGSVTR
jgi:hypothetical protein